MLVYLVGLSCDVGNTCLQVNVLYSILRENVDLVPCGDLAKRTKGTQWWQSSSIYLKPSRLYLAQRWIYPNNLYKPLLAFSCLLCWCQLARQCNNPSVKLHLDFSTRAQCTPWQVPLKCVEWIIRRNIPSEIQKIELLLWCEMFWVGESTLANLSTKHIEYFCRCPRWLRLMENVWN